MPAYADVYVTIGTLVLRTRGIDCFDWSDLFRVTKAGANRRIPQQTGRAVRPRFLDEVRAALPVRLNGFFDADGDPYVGDPHDNVYSLFGILQAVAAVNTPQVLSFTRPSGSVTANCIVEELGGLTFVTPELATVVLDVTLPGGPLELTP
jgi:hypothetical protein